MSAVRVIAVLWIAWSIFGTLVFCVFATNPRVQALQQAGSAKQASCVIALWEQGGQRATARWNMTLDYGFVATFYPCMALASWVFGRRAGWIIPAAFFTGVAIIAGLCDLIEDIALEFLWRVPTDLAAQVANVSSHIKFTLAPAPFLFVLIAGLTLLFRKNGV